MFHAEPTHGRLRRTRLNEPLVFTVVFGERSLTKVTSLKENLRLQLSRKDACPLSDEDKDVNAHISCASGIWAPQNRQDFWASKVFPDSLCFSEFEKKKIRQEKNISIGRLGIYIYVYIYIYSIVFHCCIKKYVNGFYK